jgi:septum formation protein
MTQRFILLASSSPRRQELIRTLGIPFEIKASEADETVDEGMNPEEIVTALAWRKARTVLNQLDKSVQRGVVLGADTIVVLDGEVLGKPADPEDAFRMLNRLQGNTHEVYSGVTLIDAESGHTLSGYRRTAVTMKRMDKTVIRRYIETGEPADKAGAYAIQGLGATLVEKIDGDYFNVVGLPLALLSDLLLEMGIAVL